MSPTPTYDPDTLDPFQPFCGVDDGQLSSSSTAASCRANPDVVALLAGTQYAIVTTTGPDGSTREVSPVVRFTVGAHGTVPEQAHELLRGQCFPGVIRTFSSAALYRGSVTRYR